MNLVRLRASVAAMLLAVVGAQAATLADPGWERLLQDQRFAELEQQARQRLQSQPADPQASLAVALAALSEDRSPRLEPALKQAERCLQADPQSAVCHYAAGSLLGVQAMNAGMLAGLRLAGRIKESLTRAVALDPSYFPARDALQQFHLLAPGIAGGSLDTARALAVQAEARQPEHAKLLHAKLALHERRWDDAQRLLASVRTGQDEDLRDGVREASAALGARLVQDQRLPQARGVFERLQREFPAHAVGFYGLGRVLQESGALDEALAQLDRARPLKLADRFPIDYRAALAWLGKGDTARARSLLERFVAAGKGHPQTLDEARQRLADLR